MNLRKGFVFLVTVLILLYPTFNAVEAVESTNNVEDNTNEYNENNESTNKPSSNDSNIEPVVEDENSTENLDEINNNQENNHDEEDIKSNENSKQQTKDDNQNLKSTQSNITIQSDVLKLHDQDERVRDLKKKLNRIGFNGLEENNRFDELTEKRVKEFQKYYGLLVTGHADLDTLNKVDEIYNHPLQNGKSDNRLNRLKQKLNRLGYNGIAVSPVFGNHTERRVKEFQRDHGLVVSGILEEVTEQKLKEVFKATYSEGGSHKGVADLKRKLNRIGFNGLAIANAYGSYTAKRVRDFQQYYGLPVTGHADLDTLNKVDEIYNHPLQNGKSDNRLNRLKQKLNRLGYNGIAVSPVFGNHTERRVKEFQRDHGLVVSGILEEVTEQKLKEVFKATYSEGGSHKGVADLKRKLNRIGFNGLAIANAYGSYTAKRVRDFQQYYGLPVTGHADLDTLNKVDEIYNHPLQKGKRHPKTIILKKYLNSLGYNGLAISDLYGSFTEKRVKQFQRDHGLVVSGIADDITFAKIEKEATENKRTHYKITLEEALAIQMKAEPQIHTKEFAWVSKTYIDKNNRVTASALKVRTQPTTDKSDDNKILGTLPKGTKVDVIGEFGNWYAIKYSSSRYNWTHALEKDVLYYLNPENFINDPIYKFQFLDLSRPSGASASLLNNFLKDKGILKGQGQAFIRAAQIHRINDVYLISHALLETGNGTSALAKGIEVGVNSNGKAVRVTSSNRKSLKNIKKVYNVYGIGAYDSCPIDCGAVKAYNEGWDSVSKAITGGAAFIGNSYIKAGQNTLYKMRWNPQAMADTGKFGRQYATDVGWAVKQTSNMYKLYQEIGYDSPILDIPVYKK